MSSDAGPLRISVAIPTCKRLPILRRAIDSVYSQTFSDWEIIISDDEDPPGETWRYLEELASKDPRVKVTRNMAAHGQVGNVNNALRAATGGWIKVLFDDDRLMPGCLARFAHAARRRPDAAAVVCLAVVVHNTRVTKQPYRGRRAAIEFLDGGRALLAMYLHDIDIGIPTQLMVRRSCIQSGSLFVDVTGMTSCVDLVWYTRLLQCGGLLLINEPLVEQHQGGHATVTSAMTEEALDGEFIRVKSMILPLLEPGLGAPPLGQVCQAVWLIRALHRLSRRHPLDALRLGVKAWHPRSWVLAFRWFLRQVSPGRFEAIKRTVIEA